MNLDFVEAVFTRPKMYTLVGSPLEAVSFLNGYYAGLSKMQSESSKILIWPAFRLWLADKLDVSVGEELQSLYHKHEDDFLEIICELYQEFKLSRERHYK